MTKKSPFTTCEVDPLENAWAAEKLALSTIAPDENFTIFVMVAPLSVFVNDDTALPIACAVVNVTEPAVSDPIVSLAIPNVALMPLTDTALKVAILESRVAVMT